MPKEILTRPTDNLLRKKSNIGVICQVAFCITLLLGCGYASASDGQTYGWSVKYQLGTEVIRKGEDLTVSVAADLVSFRDSSGVVLLAFPFASIDELDRDEQKSHIFVKIGWQDSIGKRRGPGYYLGHESSRRHCIKPEKLARFSHQ